MSVEDRAKAMSQNQTAKQAGEFYDSFFTDAGKNMSRGEFIRQMTGLTSHENIQTDLAEIQEQKAARLQLQARNRSNIDQAIRDSV